MKITGKITSAVFGVVFLAGCASGFETDRAAKMTPKGGNFTNALYKEYMMLAREEVGEVDYANADKFALRASSAASAKDVGPYNLKNFDIPAKALPDMKTARANLLAVKSEGASVLIPGSTARAQAMFDCWVEEQEENHQPKDIARCRAAFDKAMREIYAALNKPMPKAMPKPKPMKKKMAKISKMWFVYFGYDSAEVSDEGNAKIQEAAAYAMQYGSGKARIDVVGHTDTSGSSAYNAKLADRRVESVLGGLLDNDVPTVMMKSKSKGETKQFMKTGDNVREATNRRVTIRVRNR